MIRSWLIAALSLALLPNLLAAQDEAKVLAAFSKVFTPPPKGKATVAEKLTALQTTHELDSGKATETLTAGWLAVADELAQLDAEREAKNKEIADLLKGQEDSAQRVFEPKQLERYKVLQPEVVALRARCDELRELREKVGERIAGLHRRDSVLWLLKNVTAQKKYPVTLKLAAAKAIGSAGADILEDLTSALTRAREPEELVVLLDAMGSAGKAAQPHASPVIALLENKDPAVAERAALALAKIAVPEAIGPMIGLLSRLDGQDKLRVAGALEVLTGQQFGSNAGMWRSWWQQDGATFVASGKPLGAGKRSGPAKGDDGRYYFGIPQHDSKSILYVIDCSGSMQAEIDWTGKDGQKTRTTRLEACKFELGRALGQLRPTQKFAVLWYNDQPHLWEPKMLEATKENVARAQAFVGTLKQGSSTNIHDSLEQGFKLAGRGSRDKYYGIELDTIFLMTDGAPTRPNGTLDSTDKILVGVREWNALKRVTIHCIAMGKDLNEPFLRQLASENGGEFKAY